MVIVEDEDRDCVDLRVISEKNESGKRGM